MKPKTEVVPGSEMQVSLMDGFRRAAALRAALRDIQRGRARRAAERLESLGERALEGDATLMLVLADAQMAAGRIGTARKLAKGLLGDIGSRVESLIDQAEAAALRESQASGNPMPVQCLSRLPRYQSGVTEIDGCRVEFPDGPSAFSAWHEIYKKRMYEFRCDHPARIIDGGANIGLATLFLKGRHPQARVTCFEADEGVAAYLRKNLAAANINDVEIVAAALWETDGHIEFSGEGSDAGRACKPDGDGETGARVRVPAVRLSPYLNEQIDFLKLDIEGAELAVLRECATALKNVQRIFVEYHSFEHQKQDLAEVLSILRDAGFRVAVTVSDVLSPRPLLEIGSSLGMDMRLNLFGVRCHG